MVCYYVEIIFLEFEKYIFLLFFFVYQMLDETYECMNLTCDFKSAHRQASASFLLLLDIARLEVSPFSSLYAYRN